MSTVWFSFTHYDQINPPVWVGLRNWRYVFGLHDVLAVAGQHRVARRGDGQPEGGQRAGPRAAGDPGQAGAGLLRTVFYLPYLAPPVAATIAFAFLLNPGTGPVNTILSKVGIHGPDWFNDPAWAKPALTLLAIWGVGDLMVIFVASLLDVPAGAVRSGRAGRRRAGAEVPLHHAPAPAPVLTFAAITGVIATLQYYTQAVVAAQVASGRADQPGASFDAGYPNGSTLTLPQLVYSMGFQHFDTGSACVISVVLFAIAMAFTSVLLRRGAGFISAED